MGRLLGERRPDGASCGIILAYSHGLLVGPLRGARSVEDVRQVAESCEAADGIMLTPGMIAHVEDVFVGRNRPSLVVHLDYSNFSRGVLPYEQGAQASVATVPDVVAAGADAVMTYLLVGYDDARQEAAEIARNASISRECERWGIVHIVEPRYGLERRSPEQKVDPDIMHLYCRMSAELGADIVKCIWPGSIDAMRSIVESCPVPILVAGGARVDDDPERGVRLAQGAMDAGCRGLIFGRSIYQSDNPRAVLNHLLGLVRGTQPVS